MWPLPDLVLRLLLVRYWSHHKAGLSKRSAGRCQVGCKLPLMPFVSTFPDIVSLKGVAVSTSCTSQAMVRL